MSDILVVYYSRTGRTRLVAEALADLLGAELGEITEKQDRSGPIGYLAATKDAVLKRDTELTGAPSVSEKTLVVLGMPVWMGRPPPAVRAYLSRVDLRSKTLCAFCTSHTGGKGALEALKRLVPVPLSETFDWRNPKPDDPELARGLDAWARRIQALL